MSQRIVTLMSYLLYRLFNSLTGLGYVVFTMAFYLIAFAVRTPDPDYFVLVVGLFGGLATFLLTLSLAAKAQEAQSYPFLVRLPSRNEYLAAVLFAALLTGLILELLLAIVVLLRNEPQLSLSMAAQIPPLWVAGNILLAVLALHATDFVADGWSRVGLFGVLAVMMMVRSNQTAVATWLADRAQQLSTWSYQRGSVANGEQFQQLGGWFNTQGEVWLERLFGFAFWPFEAVVNGVIAGHLSRVQALAPAVMLLLATLLFMLAADLLAHKDLFLAEE